MTYEQLKERLKANYGDAGVYALISSDITDEDLAKGYEHCADLLGEAIADELGHEG